MNHVAIMKKSWGLIPKILAGEKTIESRWYVSRRAPWGRVSAGDVIWFRDSGAPVTARATVKKVVQLEFSGLAEVEAAVRRYGKDICLLNREPKTWPRLPRYVVLMWLADARPVKPFIVDKRGFGNAAAWLVVPDLAKRRRQVAY
jgi:hypothetical protein